MTALAVAVVLLWVAVLCIVGYLALDYRIGAMDGEDTIRRLVRQARRRR